MTAIEITSLVASLVTIVAAITVVFTAAIYYGQLRTMTNIRELESLMVLMKYIDDLELRKVRYLMLEHVEEFRTLFDVPYSWASRHAIDAGSDEMG